MSEKLKPCPECDCCDVTIDSSSAARQSWVECGECDYKLQAAVPEETIAKRWNKLPRKTSPQQGERNDR